MGAEIRAGGGRETIATPLHQNDFCVKMGSDEHHFNVSLIMKDKVPRQCPQITRSKHKKVQTNAYLTRTHGMQIFTEIPTKRDFPQKLHTACPC